MIRVDHYLISTFNWAQFKIMDIYAFIIKKANIFVTQVLCLLIN